MGLHTLIGRMLDSADTGARGMRSSGIDRPNEVEPSIEMLFRHVGAQGEAIRLLAREVEQLRAACAVGDAHD